MQETWYQEGEGGRKVHGGRCRWQPNNRWKSTITERNMTGGKQSNIRRVKKGMEGLFPGGHLV